MLGPVAGGIVAAADTVDSVVVDITLIFVAGILVAFDTTAVADITAFGIIVGLNIIAGADSTIVASLGVHRAVFELPLVAFDILLAFFGTILTPSFDIKPLAF